MYDSKSLVRAVRGPVGSGKSTAMAAELFRRAAEQTPGEDGIRRTRFVVTRNTLPQLRTTCLETIRQMFRPIMKYKVSTGTITFDVGDIHSEWVLMSLDTEENISKLLSFEITGAWASEFREIDPEIIRAIISRCGRYPSKIDGGPSWHGLVMETNSFSEDSPWYELLELDRPSNWGYWVQPGGREATAENVENLPDTYYQDLVDSNSPEWVEQYIDNKITASLAGSAVFKRSFIPDFHTASKLRANGELPLIIGMDTGRHPAAVVGQLDPRGRLLVLAEATAEGMGMENFINQILRPLLAERWGAPKCFAIIDPAGRVRSQIGEESVLQAINRLGLSAKLANTNAIEPRLRAVEKWFNKQIDGKSAILIDSDQCPLLLRSLKHDYRYKRHKTTKALEEVPEKSHPWSDLADALQYLCLGIGTSLAARELTPDNFEKPRELTAAAWT